MKSFNKKITSFAGALYATAYCSAVNAQVSTGGNTTALSILTMVRNELDIIGLSIAIIAIMVAGFQLMFQSKTWKDIAPIVGGGILIGSAAYIAGIILGKSAN